jgi:hypothetical protein
MAEALGYTDWNLTYDKDGHRDYSIEWLVKGTRYNGPASIAAAFGLPAVGSPWAFGTDVDLWAFCWPNWKISPVLKGEPGEYWTVNQTFSTKPLSRCQDSTIENPIAEPPRISGSFVKYAKEVTRDRFGDLIQSSSFEQFRGRVVEFDHNKPTVSIEMNVLDLGLATFAPIIDYVNDSAMWGLGPRMVKFSNASFQSMLYGTCTTYYKVKYDFDIDYNTFDRRTYDEGTRILAPGGDKDNPRDFIVYKDVNGENTRVLLNGEGEALEKDEDPVDVDIEYYEETNLFVLGIPASL